jgi:hypothetical protein
MDVEAYIEEIIKTTIYHTQGENHSITSYHHALRNLPLGAHKTIIPQILEGLRERFPSYSISHAIMSLGKDGKLYDISKLDDAILPLLSSVLEESYIVISWD